MFTFGDPVNFNETSKPKSSDLQTFRVIEVPKGEQKPLLITQTAFSHNQHSEHQNEKVSRPDDSRTSDDDTERSHLAQLGKDAGIVATDELEKGCSCIRCDFAPKVPLLWCFLSVAMTCLTIIVTILVVGFMYPEVWNELDTALCDSEYPVRLTITVPKGRSLSVVNCTTRRVNMDIDPVDVAEFANMMHSLSFVDDRHQTERGIFIVFDYLYRIGKEVFLIVGGFRVPDFERRELNYLSLIEVEMTNSSLSRSSKSQCFEEVRMIRGGSYDHLFPRTSDVVPIACYINTPEWPGQLRTFLINCPKCEVTVTAEIDLKKTIVFTRQ